MTRHKVTTITNQQQLGGWTEYEINVSMLEPASTFRLSRPFAADAWNLLPRDSRVRVQIDGNPVIDGFIDKRIKRSKDNTIEIEGRCRGGRLVQESAPRINYQGLELTQAAKQLVAPWFSTVTLSDAQNRKLRLGKGRRRVPAGNEPIIVRRTANGSGRVQPGTMRAAVLTELVSQAGLIWWTSADGKSVFIGRPNDDQAPSFYIRKAKGSVSGGSSNCLDLIYAEDNGDRYSLIACVGTGGGTEQDFGIAVSTRRAFVTDNADNTFDGTGADFIYPKRLLLPEKNFDSNHDAAEVVRREQIRRDFRRTTITAEMPYHGQWHSPVGSTIFAPNTVATITDEDFVPVLDLNALIYACTYRRARANETTTLSMVPAGTEVVAT